MLVLGRHENQSIRIHTSDGIIEILITKLADNHVRLGFDAPASVAIFRSEIDPSAGDYSPSAYLKSPNKVADQTAPRGIKFILRKLGIFNRRP